MAGLIEELQSEALDPNVQISTLLRKVKVAAAKLNLDDTVEWADMELKGYTERVPPYRLLRGRPVALSPRGWQTIGGKPEWIEALSNRAIGHPVSAIEEVCRNGDDELKVSYPPKITDVLTRDIGCDDAMMQLPKASFFAVLDHVRNLVLDWALQLEKAGVHGEGLTFTKKERQIASVAHMNIKIEGPNARLNLNSTDLSLNEIGPLG